jgi:hypothetical protein
MASPDGSTASPGVPPLVIVRASVGALFITFAWTTLQAFIWFVDGIRPHRPLPSEPTAFHLGWLLAALAVGGYLLRARYPPPWRGSIAPARVSTRQLWLLLAAGMAARCALYFLIPTRPVSDFLQYDNLALGLAEHHRYDGLDLRLGTGPSQVFHAGPTAFRMPAYPLLLAVGYALFGPNSWWGSLLNGLLHVAAVVALWFMVRPVLPQKWALALLYGYSFYPDLLAMGRLHGTDLPGATFVIVSMALLVSALRGGRFPLPRLAAAGLMFGLAIHCRPYLLLASPLWLALPWLADRTQTAAGGLRRCAAVLVGVALTLVPWAARNQIVLGSPLLTGTVGWQFTAYVNNSARGWSIINDRADPVLYGTDEVQMSRLGRQRALQWIRSNPAAFAARGRRRLHDTLASAGNWIWWIGYEPVGLDLSRIDRLDADTRTRMATAAHFCYGLVLGALLAALASLLPLRATRRLPDTPAGRLLALLLPLTAAIVLTVAASAFVFEGQSRYHLPALPGMILVTVLALAVRRREPVQASGAGPLSRTG